MKILPVLMLRRRAQRRQQREMELRESQSRRMAALSAALIVGMNMNRSRHYLRRKDLIQVRESPWRHIRGVGEDMSALQVMGLTWDAFSIILSVFEPALKAFWKINRPPAANLRNSGRKRIMECADVLGLVLAWIHVPAYHVMLMLVFGLTPASLSRYLSEGKRVLL